MIIINDIINRIIGTLQEPGKTTYLLIDSLIYAGGEKEIN